jgi:hypothetical protein
VRFDAEIYRAAALEHILVAEELHERRHDVLSYYAAGLAVKCMLRAYRYRVDRQFEERHDLYELAKAGRFFELVPDAQQAVMTASLLEVSTR